MEFEIAICDDCNADRAFLIRHIQKHKVMADRIHIHEYASGWELLEAMGNIAFAAIFLDIQMDGINGEETARAIRKTDTGLVLIFYTGYIGPSPFSFEVQPFRYMMKNMAEVQIAEYLDAIWSKILENFCKPMISAHIGKTQIMIKAEHILYIDKYKRGLRIHVIRQAYGTYGITACEDGNCPDIRFQGKMEDTYERLKRYGFGWPHDSYMVNCEYLCYCDAKEFRLTETEGTFQISRSKANAFREQKDRFLCSKYL